MRIIKVHKMAAINLYFCVFTLIAVFSLSNCVRYPQHWMNFVRICINTFENCPNQLVSRFNAANYRPSLASTVPSDQVVELSNNPLPSVIIWNPIILPMFHSSFQLKCPICQSELRFWKWKDGRTERDMPRKLYCIQEQVLLVSSVYLCDNHHQVLSHHPSILEELRKLLFRVPFVLFHKAGVTSELYNYISVSIHTGICIQDVENMLNLHQLQMQTCYHTQSPGDNYNFCGSPVFEIDKEFIGRKLISSIFIRSFIESEHMYTDHMSQQKGKWISFDHTFKVAANIGYWRNGLWVKMYDSLFILMNEESDILGWQLTKGTSITKVQNLLQGLKNRYHNCREGDQIQGIVVDNCCHLRNAINGIFGIHIPVKLDVFHAVQRVVKSIPKRQNNALIRQLRKQLLKDLRLCFRGAEDTGETRKYVTPEKKINYGKKCTKIC